MRQIGRKSPHVCRPLVTLSPGSGKVHNIKLNLNAPPPLSPPIFNQISLAGMNPSCQVSLLVLHEKVNEHVCLCLSKLITFQSLLRGGQLLKPAQEYILKAPFFSSPPEGSLKEKSAIFPLRLSPTILLEMYLILPSPATDMPDDLRAAVMDCLSCNTVYHLRSLN